jgi:hypothetical protein
MTSAQFRAKFPDFQVKAPDVRAACSEKARAHVLEQHKDPEFTEALRRGMAKTQKKNLSDPDFLERRKTRFLRNLDVGRRYRLEGWTFRSWYEMVLAIYFHVSGVPWVYEPLPPVPYQSKTGETHLYVPDFRVGKNQLVEFRPAFRQVGNLAEKLKASKAVLIGGKELKEMGLTPLVSYVKYEYDKHGKEHAITMEGALKHLRKHAVRFNHPNWLKSHISESLARFNQSSMSWKSPRPTSSSSEPMEPLPRSQ